jgi:hypothetical protein
VGIKSKAPLGALLLKRISLSKGTTLTGELGLRIVANSQSFCFGEVCALRDIIELLSDLLYF